MTTKEETVSQRLGLSMLAAIYENGKCGMCQNKWHPINELGDYRRIVIAARNVEIPEGAVRGCLVHGRCYTDEQFKQHWNDMEEPKDYGLGTLQRFGVGAGWRRKPQTGEPQIMLSDDIEGFRDWLNWRNIKLRNNLRTGRIEVSFQDKPWQNWEEKDRRELTSDIELCCVKFGGKTRKKWKLFVEDGERLVVTLSGEVEVDEVRDYFLRLRGTWDKEERIKSVLYDVLNVQVDEDDPENSKAMIHFAAQWMFCAPIMRTMKPGCEIDIVPVLVGPSRIGKSHFTKLLCPLGQRHHTSSLPITASPKQVIEEASGVLIAEYEEVQKYSHAKLGDMKSTTLRQVDSARVAFGRRSTDRPRRFVGIGTGNDEGSGVLQRDTTGNLRFLPLMCQGGIMNGEERIAYFKANLDQLYAEAWYMIENQGFDCLFPADLREYQADFNSSLEQVNLHTESIVERIWMAWATGDTGSTIEYPEDRFLFEDIGNGMKPVQLILYSQRFTDPKYTLANAETEYNSSSHGFNQALLKYFTKERKRLCHPDICGYAYGEECAKTMRQHNATHLFVPMHNPMDKEEQA